MDRVMDILGDKFKPQPYWWDDIDFGAQKTTDAPEMPAKTDVLVVGAGYAGRRRPYLTRRWDFDSRGRQ